MKLRQYGWKCILQSVFPLGLLLPFLASAPFAWADTVRTLSASITGKVVEATSQKVIVDRGQGRIEEINPHLVDMIFFDDEPSVLRTAKMAVAAGRYEEALTALEKVQLPENATSLVRQELEFYRSFCKARLALGTSDPQSLEQASEGLSQFINQYQNSFHYWSACELLGDLLTARGDYASASQFYGRLSKATWPELQMRGLVALGRTQLAQKKFSEAAKAFDDALQIQATGPAADRAKTAATLGKARCLAERDEPDQAIAMVQEVIKNTPVEEASLLAEAYNTLGVAHRKAGRTKEAILAFLHTDLLYFSVATQHIEALDNLVSLFAQVGQRQRAEEVAKTLRERYKREPSG